MNAKEYFNTLNENQITALGRFLEEHWPKFSSNATGLQQDELAGIGEFVTTCLQPQVNTEPTIEAVTVRLREAIQEAEAFGLVRYQDPKTDKTSIVTGAVATLTGVLLVKE